MEVLVFVPSLYLLSQTYETWKQESKADDSYDKYRFLLVGSDADIKEDGELAKSYKLTTGPPYRSREHRLLR